MHKGMTVGRWQGSEPNVMELPRDLFDRFGKCPMPGRVNYFDGVNYAELETRIMADLLALQNGDPVIYDGRHEAKVITVHPNGDVRIKFDDRNLIPPKMDVPIYTLERVLKDGSRKKYVNADVRCPKCDVPWEEIQGFRFSFYNCPACGLKKEDACSSVV